VVLDPAAAQPRIVVDVRACLPGRGAWIHPGAECLELAERRRAIPRALRADGPVDLAELREHLGRAGRDVTTGRGNARPHQRIVDRKAGQKPMGTR
jgi:hypothetical protein